VLLSDRDESSTWVSVENSTIPTLVSFSGNLFWTASVTKLFSAAHPDAVMPPFDAITNSTSVIEEARAGMAGRRNASELSTSIRRIRAFAFREIITRDFARPAGEPIERKVQAPPLRFHYPANFSEAR
jgi:hypothetical protein